MTRRRVLIVDDEDAIREIASISMTAVGGYDVVTASTGLEALDKVMTEKPDAVLLDVMMPELDGPSTVVRMQAQPKTSDVPVILLTAKVQPSERARFSALPGVAGVISKPFDPMQLPRQVAALLGWTES
jgi:CheY-like chemotaxis protein